MKIETSRSFYIYILTNQSKQIFETGVTGDLGLKVNYVQTELSEPRNRNPGKCTFLVYWELCDDPLIALNREKQIRNYSKRRKAELIDKLNPEWRFMNEEIATL